MGITEIKYNNCVYDLESLKSENGIVYFGGVQDPHAHMVHVDDNGNRSIRCVYTNHQIKLTINEFLENLINGKIEIIQSKNKIQG